jgi:hypothetical protein
MALINLNGAIDYLKEVFGLKNTPTASPVSGAPTYQIPDFLNPAKEKQVTPLIRSIDNTPLQASDLHVFNPCDIISNEEFTDVSLNEAQVQEFLKAHNSFLKDYKVEDKLASYWIYKHCSDNGVNPRIIFTHAQKEQSLISQPTLPTKQRRIDWAFGVGATDGGDNPKWKGFGNQVLGAVLTSRKWYDRGEKDNKYSIIMNLSDAPHATVDNSATFSLYKYCPWVGNQDKLIGKVLYKAPFGNFLFWSIWKKWFYKN